jgi:WhiB family transcriptional regulator, redox-sensing transcriptional regulator
MLARPETEVIEPSPSALDLAPATWWAKARCNDGNGTLSFLFFSDDLIDIARAKAICSRCVVREECLQAAIERVEPTGVWGGQLFVDGRVVANKRRRGRPPKTPRPEIVVDEVPVPPSIAARIA